MERMNKKTTDAYRRCEWCVYYREIDAIVRGTNESVQFIGCANTGHYSVRISYSGKADGCEFYRLDRNLAYKHLEKLIRTVETMKECVKHQEAEISFLREALKPEKTARACGFEDDAKEGLSE